MDSRDASTESRGSRGSLRSMGSPLVLGSGSPRRSQLLSMVGIEHVKIVVNVSEVIDPLEAPASAVERLAQAKAEAVLASSEYASYVEGVAGEIPRIPVLAADTIVCLDGMSLGKPTSPEEARHMLEALSGRTHEVYTGVSLGSGRTEDTFSQKTQVTFYERDDALINTYVTSGAPLDKAGAYGIQDAGSLFVKEIKGDYYNVVGLPLARVWRALTHLGYR